MSRKWLTTLGVAAVAAVATLAFVAASAASTSQRSTVPKTSAPNTVSQIGSVGVTYQIGKFAKRGKSLVAVGKVVAQFKPTAANPAGLQPASVTQPFTATAKSVRRFAAADRICPVLSLSLQQLNLNLLGLIVHLDPVLLTINANSRGGVLGSLFCSLSRAKVSLGTTAKKLTKAAQRSGLATKGVHMAVPLYKSTTSGGKTTLSLSRTSAPLAICPVLDLTLGPLDLNLLGLMVHLNQVHLTITADSTGGVLGNLLCSLAGGGGGARASS
jgi:hypothetical protein